MAEKAGFTSKIVPSDPARAPTLSQHPLSGELGIYKTVTAINKTVKERQTVLSSCARPQTFSGFQDFDLKNGSNGLSQKWLKPYLVPDWSHS